MGHSRPESSEHLYMSCLCIRVSTSERIYILVNTLHMCIHECMHAYAHSCAVSSPKTDVSAGLGTFTLCLVV